MSEIATMSGSDSLCVRRLFARSVPHADRGTHGFRLQLDALVIRVHARNDHCHFARTFEAQYVRFLQSNITKDLFNIYRSISVRPAHKKKKKYSLLN